MMTLKILHFASRYFCITNLNFFVKHIIQPIPSTAWGEIQKKKNPKKTKVKIDLEEPELLIKRVSIMTKPHISQTSDVFSRDQLLSE